jgi:hypothetical protein
MWLWSISSDGSNCPIRMFSRCDLAAAAEFVMSWASTIMPKGKRRKLSYEFTGIRS